MSASAPPTVFTPLKIGDITLQHRIAVAPLTRARANAGHVHQGEDHTIRVSNFARETIALTSLALLRAPLTDVAAEYYSQRADYPGTLIVSEATFIEEHAQGWGNAPGCYNRDQIAGWKKIVDAG